MRRAQCKGIIKAHGMLTRAQFQCNFGKYSTDMLEDANKCAAVVGDAAAKDLLGEGMDTFDWNEQKRVITRCAARCLRTSPGIVAK
jgi:hypothetical protein